MTTESNNPSPDASATTVVLLAAYQIEDVNLYMGIFLEHLAPAKVLFDEWDCDTAMSALLKNDEETRAELWDYTFSNIYSNSDVRVVTTFGEIIEGEVVNQGIKAQERDLLISEPTKIKTLDDGSTEPITNSFGVYAYIHNQDVSYILIDEDLNVGDEDVASKEETISDDETEFKEDDLETLLNSLEAEDQLKEMMETMEVLEAYDESEEKDNEWFK